MEEEEALGTPLGRDTLLLLSCFEKERERERERKDNELDEDVEDSLPGTPWLGSGLLLRGLIVEARSTVSRGRFLPFFLRG